MAKTFTITTSAPDTIKTDARGHAEAVYTVTNTTSRPVRAMAKAAALDSTRQEWLQITGEADRDFAAGSTQQFVVTFDAPVAAPKPAGSGGATPAAETATTDKYGFRLIVASATNPDEDFTEGQTVRVELPKAEPPKETKPFPKWIFIPIAIVLLLVIAVVVWLIVGRKSEPEKFPLPDVANVAQADAQALLESACEARTACVVVEINPIPDPAVVSGNAIRTEPGAGAEVTVASAVKLFISTGPEVAPPASPLPTPPPETYKLPGVANQPEDKAKGALEGSGKCKTMDPCVQIEINRVSDNKVPNGTVIRIDPQEGTDVQVGSKVTMFVSKGPDKVTILSVAGLAADAGRQKLEKSCGGEDCLDVETNVVPDNSVPDGKVIRTEPAAGIEVAVGSKVKMFVSGGTDEVMIPNVRNRTVVDARNLLAATCKQSTCLKIAQTSQSSDQIAAGRAIGTTPAFGKVKIGSSVVLIVSTGPELRLVGKYTGMTEQQARQKIVSDGFTIGTVKRIPMIFVPAKVNSQEPAAGAKLPKGAKINLIILGGS